MSITQGTSARAGTYRAIVRQLEEGFRRGMPGSETGHFSGAALLLFPESREFLLEAAERESGKLVELPPTEELFRELYEGNQELRDRVEKLLMSRAGEELTQHGQWVLNGRRVYDLSLTLFANLVETDFSRLRGEDIPVPLKGFYVHLSEAKRVNVERKGLVLDGMHVRQTDAVVGPCLDVLLFFVDPEYESGNALSLAFDIPLFGDVEEITRKRQVGCDIEDVRFSDQITRLIIGLCFYLSCDDADVERRGFGPSPEVKAKAKKLGGKAGKRLLEIATTPVHYLRVGHRTAATPELENLAGADATIDGETRKLLRRHVVRGHFRRQAYGPGRTERKTIFVRSFWKGPSWTEAVGAVHKVREKEGAAQ